MIYPPLLVLNYDQITYDEYINKKIIEFTFSIKYNLASNMGHSIEVHLKSD